MSFQLSEDQVQFREMATRFAREKIAPFYQKREVEAKIDRALIRDLGRLGLIAPELPEEFGGLGAPSVTTGVIAEAIGYADVNVAYLQILSSLNGKILASHASKDIAHEWLPRLIAGEIVLCIALTEPRGGSDAAHLSLSARRDGDRYILKGEKSSISMADQADAAVVFARTGRPEDGARGVSAFLVPMNAPGVSTLRFTDLGSKAIGRSSIFFDDVVVPAEPSPRRRGRRLRPGHAGFRFQPRADWLAGARLGAGLARRELGLCPGASGLRRAAVEKPGRDLPAVGGRNRRRRRAPALLLHFGPARRRATAYRRSRHVQMLAPKTAVDVIHHACSTHGHYGWSLDMPHQQRLRDVMGLEIGDGTAQIMKMIIAREKLSAARS